MPTCLPLTDSSALANSTSCRASSLVCCESALTSSAVERSSKRVSAPATPALLPFPTSSGTTTSPPSPWIAFVLRYPAGDWKN